MLDFSWVFNLEYLRFHVHLWCLFIDKEFRILLQSSRKKMEGNKRYSLLFYARKMMLFNRRNA